MACHHHQCRQGATVDRAYVLASGSMNRHLAYVAMTRHKDGVTMHAGRDDFKDMAALTKTLSRSGLKETTLDYLKDVHDFAERRGFNGDHAIGRMMERGQQLLDTFGKRLEQAMDSVRERFGLERPASTSARRPEVKGWLQSENAAERVYLDVPHGQVDQAREAGARWDRESKNLVCPAGRRSGGLSEMAPRARPGGHRRACRW